WKGSDPAVGRDDPNWKQGKVSPLVDLWWVMYGLVPLIGFATSAGFLTNLSDADLDRVAKRIDDYLVVNVGLALVGAATAVVYYTMIRQLAARHMAATGEA